MNLDYIFRGVHVLYVKEADEPDTILWKNLEVAGEIRNIGITIEEMTSVALMVAVFYGFTLFRHYFPSFIFIFIASVDLCLPYVFLWLTSFAFYSDENKRQNGFLNKLFVAKILTTVIFNYLLLQWNQFLDPLTLQNVTNIQLSSCIFTPLLKCLDISGFFNRQIFSRFCASNQPEMNSYYVGSEFTLADRITEVSKIVFIALFYSILNPFSLFLSTIACLVNFFVDRYLLFRKLRVPSLLDEIMASTLRKQIFFSIACHCYVTSRFIYSWPQDSSYKVNDSFVMVDKSPPINIFMASSQDWQTSLQSRYFYIYRTFMCCILVATIFAIFAEPLYEFWTKIFRNVSWVSDQAKPGLLPYSKVDNISAYCPTVNCNGERFIICDVGNMLKRHFPKTTQFYPDEDSNIGNFIPEKDRPHVLSVVKWYGDEEANAEEHVKFGDKIKYHIIKTGHRYQRSNVYELGEASTLATSPEKPVSLSFAAINAEIEKMISTRNNYNTGESFDNTKNRINDHDAETNYHGYRVRRSTNKLNCSISSA